MAIVHHSAMSNSFAPYFAKSLLFRKRCRLRSVLTTLLLCYSLFNLKTKAVFNFGSTLFQYNTIRRCLAIYSFIIGIEGRRISLQSCYSGETRVRIVCGMGHYLYYFMIMTKKINVFNCNKLTILITVTEHPNSTCLLKVDTVKHRQLGLLHWISFV